MVLSLNLLIGGSFLMLFPESPKFLLARGEKKQALQILRNMFAKNYNKNPEDYPVIIILSSNLRVLIPYFLGEDIIGRSKNQG